MPGRKGQASKTGPVAYGQDYYALYCSVEGDLPYGRSDHWLSFFGRIADRIVEDIKPRTVLDAGCAMGLLVEALRDRGVDAEGVDISDYAISQGREDVRPHLWVGSILEPLPGRYDLIVCIETLEHLAKADAEKAVDNFCEHTDDVLFSSSPGHFKEVTHVNVQPTAYWAELFARHGFLRDLEIDLGTVLNRWAGRYRRSEEPLHRLVADYERQLWRLTDEVTELRELAHEHRTQLVKLREQTRAQLDSATAELERVTRELDSIKRSRAYEMAVRARGAYRRLVPRRG